jgi:hypothetical protein
VDDAVRLGRGLLQDAGVAEVAADDIDACGRQLVCGCVRAGQAGDLVAGASELGDEGGADVAGSSGDEDSYSGSSL